MESHLEYVDQSGFLLIKIQNKLRDFFSIVLEAYGLFWFICKLYITQGISEPEMFLIKTFLDLPNP